MAKHESAAVFFRSNPVFTCQPACAATFQAKRGISLDIWVTWPDEFKWGDESVLLPFPEWRRTVGQKELADLKAAGFDFVRMPIDPSPFLSEKSAALHDKLFDEVAASVKLITNTGLKVILDLHALPAGGNRSIGTSEILKDGKLFEAHAALVRRMAAMLTDHIPESVALELFNEPTIDCDSDGTNDWPAKLKALTIRPQRHVAADSDPLRRLLGRIEGLAKLNPKDFADDNVIWSFHSYDPFILTHQGATWTGDFMPHVYGLPFPLHEADKDALEKTYGDIRARIQNDAPRARRSGHLAYFDEQVGRIDTGQGLADEMDRPFALVADWAKTNNVDPSDIILGEFGMIRQEYGNPVLTPGKTRAAYVKAMAQAGGGGGVHVVGLVLWRGVWGGGRV